MLENLAKNFNVIRHVVYFPQSRSNLIMWHIWELWELFFIFFVVDFILIIKMAIKNGLSKKLKEK